MLLGATPRISANQGEVNIELLIEFFGGVCIHEIENLRLLTRAKARLGSESAGSENKCCDKNPSGRRLNLGNRKILMCPL